MCVATETAIHNDECRAPEKELASSAASREKNHGPSEDKDTDYALNCYANNIDPTAPTDAPPSLTEIEEAVGSPLVSSTEKEHADATGDGNSEDNFEPSHNRFKEKETEEKKDENGRAADVLKTKRSPKGDTISNAAATSTTVPLAPLSCALSDQSSPPDPVVTPSGHLCSHQVLLTKLTETRGIDPFDPIGERTLDESQLIVVKTSRVATMPADAPSNLPIGSEPSSLACGVESGASQTQRNKPISSLLPKRYQDRMIWGDYTGEYNELGRRHGHGIIKYENGNVYEGEWRNNEKDGRGRYEFPNGKLYIGEFKRNTAEGRGTHTFPNGSTYEGEFRGGKREGCGVMHYANGNSYEGEWRNGKREGRGVMVYANGNSYDGEWRNDQMEGNGTYVLHGGRKYCGEFRGHKFEGCGIMTFNNGNSYDGQWRNDQMEGNGTFLFVDGRKYCGEFKRNTLEGCGTYTFADGRVEVSRYHAGVCIGKGARWSSDRKKTWRTIGGKAYFFERIRLKKAAAIAERLGLPAPE